MTSDQQDALVVCALVAVGLLSLLGWGLREVVRYEGWSV